MADNQYRIEGRLVSRDEYQRAKYDDLRVRVARGGKEAIQTHAAALRESINSFIGRAIQETMERDSRPREATEGAGSAGAPAPNTNATAKEIVEEALEQAGVSKAELARRLGWSAQLLRQRLNTGKLSVAEWESIGEALGARLRIEFDFGGG